MQVEDDTHSLPVQNVDASDASQAITPLSSSGRPIRPSGFKLDHLSNKCGCVSRYAAVILHKTQLRQLPGFMRSTSLRLRPSPDAAQSDSFH